MLHLSHDHPGAAGEPQRPGLRDAPRADPDPRPRPGAKLSLHELAAELGVSRSPVHHALTRLVSEGLLSVKARRGYFVTPVTSQALLEGYEVRLALQLHAADVAVDTASDEQVTDLRRRHIATVEAISHEEWDAANASFHEAQVDLAGTSSSRGSTASSRSTS